MNKPMQFVRPPSYECDICKDTGWILTDRGGLTYSTRCSCYQRKLMQKRWEQSGISEEFRSKGFKNFETRDNPQLINAKNKAIRYMQEFPNIENTRYNSILLCGQVGAGKTHLGMAISQNLIQRSVPVVYMAYRNVATKIKQVITDENAYMSLLQSYMSARVLFIDDLLKGRVTESDINILYELVNHRYMNSMPMIISTEFTVDSLLQFDEAIASRIIEMCRGNIIQLQGLELNYRLN